MSETRRYTREHVWRLLHEYGGHPYHLAIVQALMLGSYARKVDDSNCMLNILKEKPLILDEVLWTNESMFTRVDIVNVRNVHYWSLEPPRHPSHTTSPDTLVDERVVQHMGNPFCWTPLLSWDFNE